MERIARFIERHRLGIVVFWGALILLSLFLAGQIEVVTETRQMLPQNNPRVEAFNDINDRFSTGSFLVTVEGSNRSEMIAAAQQVADGIESSEAISGLVDSVQLRIDEEFVNNWGLLLQEEEDLRNSLRLLETNGLTSFLTTFNDNLEETYAGDEGSEEVDTAREEIETAQFLSTVGRATALLRRAIEEPGAHTPEDVGRQVAEMLLLGDPYSFDRTNSMLVFTLLPTFSVTDMEKGMRLTGEVRRILGEISSDYPELSFGYAGDIAQNYDEQQATSSDLFWPTLVAFVVILFLFIFSFAQVRGVVFALLSLAVGILTTVGYIAVTLAEINLITSSFAVLLMGLGVDFGIHFLSNYDDYRSRGLSPPAAVAETYRSVVPAIVIGAVATAIAFGSLLLTGTGVMRQFAIVAGGGILVCLTAMLTLLPAFLILFASRREGERRLPLLNYGWISTLGLFCVRYRWPVIVLSLLLTVGGAFMIPRNQFLYDITELGPQKATSAVTQRKIEDRMGFSPFPMMVTYEELSQARAASEALKEERMVASLSSLSQYIAPQEEQRARLSMIRDARSGWVPPTAEELGPDTMEDLTYEIQRLEWNMIEIGDLSVAALGEGNLIQRQRDEMIREVLGAEVGEPGDELFQQLIAEIAATPERSLATLNEVQSHFLAEIKERAQLLLAPERPITPADLPETITDRTVSKDGRFFLVTAIPSAEVEEQEALFRFRDRMLEVDESMTGTIPISIEFIESITEEIGYATIYISAALLLILVLTFRKLSITALIAVSMVAAVAVMFGLFPLLGITMNVLNVMVLPLIFGLGVDYFIHVAHRLREERELATALRLTGKGVVLSAATTMIAFGSLGLIGRFRAIQLLGQMLFVGIGIVLLASLTLLPALLSWLHAGGKLSKNNPSSENPE